MPLAPPDLRWHESRASRLTCVLASALGLG
jgi:hypothetical protein